MANKKAFQDEVKNKNRRARKDQRKKKKKTQGSLWNSLATIFGSKVFRSLLTFVLAMAIGGVGTYLYMNSRPSQETVLVRMKGKTITVADLYESSKGSDATKSALLQKIFSTMLEDKYGKKVSDDKVNDKYQQYAKQYGNQLTTLLSQNGLTTDTFKQNLRVQALQEYAFRDAAKKDLNDKKLQELYKDYNPEITVSYIKTDDKDKASSLHDQAAADGADFSQIAKDNSGQENVSFDSGTSSDTNAAQNLPPEDVQKAAFKLDNNAVSDVIESEGNDGSKSYYVVKVTAKNEKNPDWKSYKKRLTEIYVNKKIGDSKFTNNVIAKLLKEYNVTIEDKTYSSLLSNYGLDGSTASSSKKSK
ncbi:Protease maturation protein [Streptococcus criceti]|uniref:Foldase protein PrsA n=1 Tax=Streptococcus criceti HS-6 TaxID=873449 RepID=G5JS05_STRCG|nr:peptidyl-prolyl cis-trans isomerase [Streptococcus criceti]EHI75474.1 putative foldase protein PrsA [Streptococcus criceti HS-6]SUN42836.1 Protease maturation protein [Streptococcus criceti]